MGSSANDGIMEIRRFFANPCDRQGNRIIIRGDEFAHLTRVLRYKVGYKAIVCLDESTEYECSISEINKDYAVAEIDKTMLNQAEPDKRILLCQALPKGDKLDLIVQKCVELGVGEILPFRSRYVSENKFNKERLDKIALQACKQCGRSKRVIVDDLAEFDEMLDVAAECDVIILPYENAQWGSIGQIEGLNGAQSVAIIIGSEGGFDEQEVQRAKERGAKVVSLGKRILRCETAAIVACALTTYEMGEMNK
ncbi:MAG: RsmE family RNA methyltransferase [Christensenellales bacterium]